MDLSTIIANYIMQFVSATPVVVVVANAISMLLPSKLNTKKDNWYIKAGNIGLSVLNILSMNILKNKNAK